jgi:hypothetical protein
MTYILVLVALCYQFKLNDNNANNANMAPHVASCSQAAAPPWRPDLARGQAPVGKNQNLAARGGGG